MDQRNAIRPARICCTTVNSKAKCSWVCESLKLTHMLFVYYFRPTLDEIRMWGKSFDKLMKSPGK